MIVRTVGELITELRKYPEELKVSLSDPDTSWEMPLHIEASNEEVWFTGSYSEAKS